MKITADAGGGLSGGGGGGGDGAGSGGGGGADGGGQTTPAVSFGRGVFTPTGSMNQARRSEAAVRLGDGRVLVAGSDDFTPSADLFDPSQGTFSPTGEMSRFNDRGRCYGCAAALLTTGRVLIAGGWRGFGAVLTDAELYDPEAATFSPSAGIMSAIAAIMPGLLKSMGTIL